MTCHQLVCRHEAVKQNLLCPLKALGALPTSKPQEDIKLNLHESNDDKVDAAAGIHGFNPSAYERIYVWVTSN